MKSAGPSSAKLWTRSAGSAAASRADHVIDAVKLYDDLPSAVADLNFVFATTARERDGFKEVRGPVEAGRALRSRQREGLKTGILFGRERFGLYNDEVGLADEIVTFPVDPAFSSLNIAQAVLLMSYEWMKSGLENETDTNFSSAEMLPAFQQHVFFARRVDTHMRIGTDVEWLITAFADHDLNFTGIEHGTSTDIELYSGEHRAGDREAAIGDTPDGARHL